MTACMGGFCALRDKCPHYNADDTARPAERLCLCGEDGWQVRKDRQGMVREFVLPAVLMNRNAVDRASV